MFINQAYEWEFPLERTHCGILQGNGTMGALIWGGGSQLNITIGRADFWDHRGGLEFGEEVTYANVCRCLEANDEEGLRSIFYRPPANPGDPQRPTVLPIGRLELDFGTNAEIKRGLLAMDTGEVTIEVQRGDKIYKAELSLLMDSPYLIISLEARLTINRIARVPSWEFVGDYLKTISFEPPEMLDSLALSGWMQTRPNDPPLCLGYRRTEDGLIVTTTYDGPEAAERGIETLIGDIAGARRANRGWWADYWKRVPEIQLPSETLMFIYYYGMYKFAGLTNPTGVAATLQGPWIEEYQMPPWSSDYHFNINVQECYWPTFAANLLDHIVPLFEMLNSWKPKLQANAKTFLGIDDGLMLPHAVDDRGVCMGGFWTGSIDHGSTAWVAQLMWLYYRYSMDKTFLRQQAYPFLKGAMRSYEALLEWDGDTPSLPVSVSPEYRGDSLNAWGKNASFQLACVHFLCKALRQTSEILGTEFEPTWAKIEKNLPRVCLIGREGNEEIALWEGTALESSHRHHSHLAGIYPFDTLDPRDPRMAGIVARSIRRWGREGIGEWSGWCVPWASIIHSRLRNGGAAELLLEVWERVFTNEGHGTLHNVAFGGISVMGEGPVIVNGKNREIMQIEAGMGTITAVQEMLLQNVDGVIRVMAGVPKRWKDVSFKGMRAEGAFLISAERRGGVLVHITVMSEVGGLLRIENNLPPEAELVRGGQREKISGALLEIETSPGERVEIQAKEI